MFVKDMSVEKLQTTRDAMFSQQAYSQADSSLVTSQLAASKSTPAWNQRMGDGRRYLFCSQTLIIVSSSRLLWNWSHAGLLAVTNYDVDESPIHAQILVSAGSPMIHVCTNNFRLTSVKFSTTVSIDLKHLLISRLLIFKNKIIYCIYVDCAATIPVSI